MMLTAKLAAAMISVCAVALGASASAKTVDIAPTNQAAVVVNYSDLDLNTDSGAAALRERFNAAALQVKRGGT